MLAVQKRGDTGTTSKALAELCEIYWYPLYSFARRLGYRPHDCQDLTQGFFCYVVDKDLFATADRELGKLRTFLLTTFRRYLAGVKDHENAGKRGGAIPLVSLDVQIGEERYANEPAEATTPEMLFERNWAYSVLRSALAELAANEERAGRGAQYAMLAPFLSPETEATETYESVAPRLEVTAAGARQAVSRLRKKFRDLLRNQIADTLLEPTPEQVDLELIALRNVLQA